jgi:Skp family chaperone for outer membrane proteins
MIKNAGGELADVEQAKSDANDLLAGALEALEDLEAMCVKGEETLEERKAAREAEIETLKEALSIFEDWQK